MNLYRGNNIAGALFSPCEKYRYALWRRWHEQFVPPQMVAFVGLNPSTATESDDDPTVTRCIRFAKAWGFDGMYMLNLFAYRATKPKDMKAQEEPVGEGNDLALADCASLCQTVVCAWGTHGKYLKRSKGVLDEGLLGPRLHAMGLNADGSPAHPLFLKKDLKPRLWYWQDGLLAQDLPFTEAA